MLIGNPKIRTKVNNILDCLCVGVFYIVAPIAIVVGGLVGLIKKPFVSQKE